MEPVAIGAVLLTVLTALMFLIYVCWQTARAWRKTEAIRRHTGAVITKGVDLIDAGAEATYRASVQLEEASEKWMQERCAARERASELERKLVELEDEASNEQVHRETTEANAPCTGQPDCGDHPSRPPCTRSDDLRKTAVSTWQRSEEPEKNELLDACKVQYLFHMTHVRNLPGILERGLLSHNVAHRSANPVDISMTSVNDLRSRKTDPFYGVPLHDYVPLYFNPKNPMMYARKNLGGELVVLAFDRKLIMEKGVVFTEGNAAAGKTTFFSSVDSLSEIDWEFMWARYWHYQDEGKRRKCAEVLIPSEIPADWIRYVVVRDSESLDRMPASVTSQIKIETGTGMLTWH